MGQIVGRGGLGRLWHGRVTRVDGTTIYVEIPEMVRGREFKCEDWTRLSFVVSAGDHSHTVTTAPLVRDNEVLVGFLGPDRPAIVGRKVP